MQTKKTIFLVEENTLVRRELRSLLRASGYTVSVSKSATAAEQDLSDKQPALVLFGIDPTKQGELSGLGALAKQTPAPIICIVTDTGHGLSSREAAELVQRYGARDVLHRSPRVGSVQALGSLLLQKLTAATLPRAPYTSEPMRVQV